MEKDEDAFQNPPDYLLPFEDNIIKEDEDDTGDNFQIPAYFGSFDLETLVSRLYNCPALKVSVRNYFGAINLFATKSIVSHIRNKMTTDKLSRCEALYQVLKLVLNETDKAWLSSVDNLVELYPEVMTVAQKNVPERIVGRSDFSRDVSAMSTSSGIKNAIVDLCNLASEEAKIHVEIAKLLFALRAHMNAKKWHDLSGKLEPVLSYAPSVYCEFISTVPQGLLDLKQSSFRVLKSLNSLIAEKSKSLEDTPECYLGKMKTLRDVSTTADMMKAVLNQGICTADKIQKKRGPDAGISSVSVRT
jgi:hypothetical protein